MALPTLSRPFFRGRAPFSAYDVPVAAGILALAAITVHVGSRMAAPAVPETLTIDLSPWSVPYYALRSTARMFLAYFAALAFTFTYGSIAAHSRRAERVLMPLLDILQSIPVLGFLSATIGAFIALFPGSVLGMELASIFAIFTSQAWNMAFSFFQSVRAIPRDLIESAAIHRLTPFQRFARLEVPYAMNGLVWNSMVSFGGGWFFLAASEAITVLGQDIRLPGLGSYLATAVQAGDFGAIGIAIGTTVLVVVGVDFLFFRPFLAWAQKFSTSGALDEDCESSILTAIQRSRLVEFLGERVATPVTDLFVNRIPARLAARRVRTAAAGTPWLRTYGTRVFLAAAGALILWHGVRGATALVAGIDASDVTDVLLAGLATLARVLATVAIASIVWVPIGTFIGARPGLARRIRPIIQLGAAFPANLVFPLLVLAFVRVGVDLSWGSVLLMLLATQWYVLFNVIVGVMSVPQDLLEVGRVFRLSRWQRFRRVTAPVLLPFWVTGALTAAGGAWNASIVAEVARVGDSELFTFGLGSYMAQATIAGDWPGIVLSIVTMAAFVVATNRLLWRRLYVYAEEHLGREE
ncbi:MAG: ABC transporter permease subunit [Deltaproteobacteria bacterium]|nr:ABC transporter permease subunit [Deltaproteobacteria bacterium]